MLLNMPLIDYRFLGKIIPKGKIKKSFTNAKSSYLNRVRWATALFFFGMGFCFATWASRIPDIKLALKLSEAELGTLLFALPIGQLVAMPFSGKVVTEYGSRKIAIIGLFMYAVGLTLIGLATTSWQLALNLFLFGFFGNFCNIAVNTQGVFTQQLFEKPIMGSFHGSWSLAGFCGALLGLIVLAFQLSPFQHFVIVLFIIAMLIFLNYPFLIKVKSPKKEEEKEKLYGKRRNYV
jgi:MFS family permease